MATKRKDEGARDVDVVLEEARRAREAAEGVRQRATALRLQRRDSSTPPPPPSGLGHPLRRSISGTRPSVRRGVEAARRYLAELGVPADRIERVIEGKTDEELDALCRCMEREGEEA